MPPVDYFANGSQQISQAIVFDDSRAKAIANMPDGSIRFVTNPGRPSASEDLVWASDGSISLRGLTSFGTPPGGILRNVTPGGQLNLVSNLLLPVVTGTVQQIGLSIEMTAAAAGAPTNRIPLYLAAQTGNSGDPITGLNVDLQQNAGNPASSLIGLELDIANNKADATYGMSPPIVGYSAVSGGSKVAEYAFSVGGTGKWVCGLQVAQGGIAAGGFAFRYDGNGASGIVSINADSTLTLPLGTGSGIVSVGAGDSGGAGFKVLRVPN